MIRQTGLLVLLFACDATAADAAPDPKPAAQAAPPSSTKSGDATPTHAPPAGDTAASTGIVLTFDKDEVGGPAAGMEPLIGDWRVGEAAGARGPLEHNILFFHVVRGKRTVLENVRNTPKASTTWHTLVATIRGKQLTVELDGKQYLQKTLDAAPTGRVGLWSKADSQVLFDEFRVERL